MQYFAGIRFNLFSWVPTYSDWIDRTFEDYAIQYNHAGRITLVVEGAEPVTLDGPVCWLTYPGPRFQYGTRDGTSWSHHFVNFSGPRVRRYVETDLFPIGRAPSVIPIRQAQQFHTAFADLLTCLREDPGNTSRAVHLLEGLLLQLHEQDRPTGPEPSHEPAVRAVSRAIRADPVRGWDFRDEARRLHMSYTNFRRLFRWFIGMAPQQFVIQSRLDKGAELLRDTNMTLQAISTEIGMDDLYYFAKSFRRHYQIAPGQYRRNHRRAGRSGKGREA